ncbi:MAG: segregation and condensation protein A [Candidatus Magnetoglobus multicellularis str. Araruama]|uniref:Segregation and condensation protein A n=1 Tax=Candidatus Magnetoglobus multicellularis str. Araruama TaxID=890399 RepID=A0A1V1P6Z5_9BACT|nr:MAG: segregation and condensation protein A [Candidatus Magnetoglobus multicellularis str. Araruama]
MDDKENDIEKYQVHLEAFEGPLDLLLHLVQVNRLDIHAIPIALITDQYLIYIEDLSRVDLDSGGDFLVMAATLTQIKSKSLLPKHEDVEKLPEEQTMDLVLPIVEYLKMKAAAKDLLERDWLEKDLFVRNPEKDFESDETPEIVSVDIVRLIETFQQMLSMMPEDTLHVTKEGISIKDRISQIIDILEERPTIAFTELFRGAPSRADMIITFLALLEMAKLAIIQIGQNVKSGLIEVVYI